ncbi:GPI mannosyltransferase 1 [Aspergillus melleus]|uniref:GPI mannosyltransferase 1 n=1 Tax=Aspergillus melleus TaxID=138277 RepID=A0ACC3B411_9EURO|nr:GPI mannosyltransferase 1 [Aspergillus melleus]
MAFTSFFHRPSLVYGSAIALRAILLVYGAWQDAHSAVKYTDIDYMVFTDAARYVAHGASPYARDTYRYTPLLAWLLIPTSWTSDGGSGAFFLFGKVLFALSDVLAGWLIVKSLTSPAYGMDVVRARKYAAVWLLNPMVANISTRGSSEGLLCVMVIALLWAVLRGRVTLAGVLLGLSVHFKIYPFVYGAAVVWWLDGEREESLKAKSKSASASTAPPKKKEEEGDILSQISSFLHPSRLHLTLTALATFSALNLSMYIVYGYPFLHHTYLHHVTRIDHRHNFSPYSTLLYLSASAMGVAPGTGTEAEAVHGSFESLAFIPQLFLSVVAIPLVLGKKSLPGTMLAQTFAFVTFNKYFLWYLVFLPFYLPESSLLQRPKLGLVAAALWVLAQAAWLHQGYLLEFLGVSSFVPGLYLAGLGFFAVNVWLLGIIVGDVGAVQ